LGVPASEADRAQDSESEFGSNHPDRPLQRTPVEVGGDGDAIKITAMPVFSNVGEPGCGSAPCERAAAAVVFGLAGVEDRIFGTYRFEIERIISALGIEKILDVGPRFSSMPRTFAGAPVISKGVLPQGAVSELLQRARFGFVAYPLDFIGKSGIFAAYAAHGVIPIVLSDKQRRI
jgi:hypothetical protein